MTLSQLIFGSALALVLLALAVLTCYWQWRLLRRSYASDPMSDEDRVYYRTQSRRRIASAVLMVVLAGLLIGSFFLEERAQNLADTFQQARERGEAIVPTPEQASFRDFYALFWGMALLLLLSLLTLALLDYFAIRRFSRRNFQQLREERQAMIRAELERFRREKSERN